MFGPNATLDVQGSFHVSTADYLRLADGARFFARLSEQSTFSVAPPVAFGFLGPTPEPITVNGSALQVPRGETLSLVGGEITIAGNVVETAVNVPTDIADAGCARGAHSPSERGVSGRSGLATDGAATGPGGGVRGPPGPAGPLAGGARRRQPAAGE